MIDWHWVLVMVLMISLAMSLALWPLRQQRGMWLWVLLLLVGSSLAYWQWGGWRLLLAYQHQEAQHQKAKALLQTVKNPQELIQKLQTHLASQPDSARGWYLLGRLYASQRQWDEALQAFKRAYENQPEDDQIAVNYAQSLLMRHQGRDEETARHLLQAVLVRHPQQADALAMLALDAQHYHHADQALYYWEQLLRVVSPQSEEADAIRKAILMIRSQQ